MADDEIVVEIEKDNPEPKAGEQTTDVADALKAQLTELQAETARERQDKEAANRRAADAERGRVAALSEVAETRTEITETRLGTVEQGLSAAQSASDAAKSEYKAAMEAGNWDKAAEAQEKLADARATLGRLTEAKADLEVQKAQPQRQQTRVETPQTQADPVEAFISQRSAPTQAWLRAHPEDARALALDPEGRRGAKINAADSDARAEGFKRDTPEYFAHVDNFLGITKPNGKAANGNGQTQRRAASAPVAPVASSAGGVSGGTEVRLSAGEARVATDGTHTWGAHDLAAGRIKDKSLIGQPIGHAEMARRKLAMQQQGLYDKSYVEQ